MQHFIKILLVLFIGLAGGGYSAFWAIDSERGFGAVKIGQWTSWPLAGSIDADPYTKARVARDGSVPLGLAEGLAFYRMRDQSGRPLRRQCRYTVSGSTPTARLWTLSVQDENKQDIEAGPGAANTVFSQSLLRAQNGSFVIEIGRNPAPGNWLAITGSGPMRLVLRLYDTPVGSSVGLIKPDMPVVINRGCVA